MRRYSLLPLLVLLTFIAPATFAQEPPLAGQVLPFELDYATASGLYEDGLRFAQVDVWVTGGSSGDWAATGIAIAELAATGEYVDSVKVTVRDGNLRDMAPEPGMALLARVYYSPDPGRSVWDDLGLAAEYAKRTNGRYEVQLQQFYERMLESYLDSNTDFYEADIAAAKSTIKAFGLTGELRVPGPNLMSSEYGRDTFKITGTIAPDLTGQLAACLNNPANQPTWGCKGLVM